MAKKLFVAGLSYSVTSAQLEELFAQVGKVDSANVITDKFSGQSRGFAFVEMASDADADEAIKKFNNFELEGRKIIVNVARPKEDSDRGNQFRSGGGDRRPNKRW